MVLAHTSSHPWLKGGCRQAVTKLCHSGSDWQVLRVVSCLLPCRFGFIRSLSLSLAVQYGLSMLANEHVTCARATVKLTQGVSAVQAVLPGQPGSAGFARSLHCCLSGQGEYLTAGRKLPSCHGSASASSISPIPVKVSCPGSLAVTRTPKGEPRARAGAST